MMPKRQNPLPHDTVGSTLPTTEGGTSKVDPLATIADAGVTGTVMPTNDNSNPQQGSGCVSTVATSNIVTATLRNPTTEHHQAQDCKLPQNNIQQTQEDSSGDLVTSIDMHTLNSSISNVGFLKDARKLFVGGLPQDSE
jgi:hypothetical protein